MNEVAEGTKDLETLEATVPGFSEGGGPGAGKSGGVRKATLLDAGISFGFLIVVMSVSLVKFKLDPHIPMFIGVIAAAIMGLRLGYSWSSLEKAMIRGISQAMQSIIILAIIGMLIGVWIVSGVVPSMILYGLDLLSPKIFLPATYSGPHVKDQKGAKKSLGQDSRNEALFIHATRGYPSR